MRARPFDTSNSKQWRTLKVRLLDWIRHQLHDDRHRVRALNRARQPAAPPALEPRKPRGITICKIEGRVKFAVNFSRIEQFSHSGLDKSILVTHSKLLTVQLNSETDL